MMACDSGMMNAPVMPCAMRATTSTVSESAAPQKTDAIMKPSPALMAGIHNNGHRHAGAQLLLSSELLHLEQHWDALHDFDPIARGILRRQNRELSTGGRRNRGHLPFPLDIGICVRHHVRHLTR